MNEENSRFKHEKACSISDRGRCCCRLDRSEKAGIFVVLGNMVLG